MYSCHWPLSSEDRRIRDTLGYSLRETKDGPKNKHQHLLFRDVIGLKNNKLKISPLDIYFKFKKEYFAVKVSAVYRQVLCKSRALFTHVYRGNSKSKEQNMSKGSSPGCYFCLCYWHTLCPSANHSRMNYLFGVLKQSPPHLTPLMPSEFPKLSATPSVNWFLCLPASQKARQRLTHGRALWGIHLKGTTETQGGRSSSSSCKQHTCTAEKTATGSERSPGSQTFLLGAVYLYSTTVSRVQEEGTTQ